MKRRHIILLLVCFLFGTYCVYAFQSTATPYVTISESQHKFGNVQIKGVLDKDKPYGMQSDGHFHFFLKDDEGTEAEVVYHGLKPDGFDDSVHIVAIGKYVDNQIQSDKLLIKCPSKYEGKRPA